MMDGFGRGPTTIPPEEDNRAPHNLMRVIFTNNKPVCYIYNAQGLHTLFKNGRREQSRAEQSS